ncbi:hypothetical protein AB0N89_03610 [Amycolatopsis sp. NPDC089917]|uniref:hypothetical protein n=1 Tax=Amycolatopsis sp. NPDC089917 TaxID=3155187 RepID=UPI00341E7469
MRTSRFALVAAVAAVTLLSACGTRSTPAAPDAASLPAVQGSAAAAPADGAPAGSNAQGRIPKKLGEAAGFTGRDGKTQSVTFSIDKIAVNPKCDPYMKADAGKHTLVLDVRVATNQLSPEDAIQLGATINPFSFQTVTPDGVTTPVEFGMCKGSSLKSLPTTWASNSKYSGQMELQVTAKSGVLALIPGGFGNAGGGWEWTY